MKKNLRLPNHSEHQCDKCLFILRLWRVDQSNTADWRASVEIPETGKRIGFSNLEQLFAFLMDLSESKADIEQIEEKGVEECKK